MPHALLLSPDDQAVSAITGVLEEMSVTCERPLDGPSAAKKLSSQSFDLVLVDCENLPAAKLIFDVCRRATSGGNPIPIAIVDGRAGLPTAFRLGAELILTKPVAKDQARTTIRTAVNRLKKDEPARAAHPVEEAPAEVAEPAMPETRAHAAAAVAASSLPKIGEFVPPAARPESPVGKMQSPVEEIAAPPASPKRQSSLAAATAAAPSKPAPPREKPQVKPSDDPVLADLEAENDAPTPVFTSYKEPQKKKGGSGSMVALLFLLLAGGGLYAAWMYQPGFREMAQPQIDRVLALIPMSHPAQSTGPVRQGSAPKPVPPTATQAPVTTSAPLPSSSAGDAPDGSISPPASSKDASGSDQQTSTAAVPAPDSGAETTSVPPDANKKGDAKKNVLAAIPSDTELPGEKTAVILSSQGAEKRLVHHVQPAYPADARREHLEGTVILKAVVDENGRVEGVRLVEGNPTLAAAAIGAVKQWRYRPYLRDGQPQPFKTVVLVDFQRR